MSTKPPTNGNSPWQRQWWTLWTVALATLTGVITLLSIEQHRTIVANLLFRDAGILNALIDLEYRRLAAEPFVEDEYLDLALKAAQLEGVLAFAIYDHFGSLLAEVPEGLAWQFMPAGLLANAMLEPPHPLIEWLDEGPQPILQIVLPGKRVRSFAETVHFVYWMEGTSTQEQIQSVGKNLWRNAWLLWLSGIALLTALFAFALSRQRKIFRQLADRTQSLQEANSKLTLAAKTSAVGAISAHLLHALKNPLSGLKQHLRSLDPDGAALARLPPCKTFCNTPWECCKRLNPKPTSLSTSPRSLLLFSKSWMPRQT
ncbi:MAG: hypothetical protein LR015_06385 [Verrucomicrobia bacterium]|nr:hypothetical protein [Verrucomicrobiota bacterium]